MDAPGFVKEKAHTMHGADKKINTFDQNGFLYDGATFQPLELPKDVKLLEKLKEKYAIPDGAPFSAVQTEESRINAAVATLRASGAIDADSLSKFENLLKRGMSKDK